MSEHENIELKLRKGKRYLIEIEPKKDIDAMERGSVMEAIFGDSADDVNVVKFWFIGSNEMLESILDKVGDFTEELKQTARNFFNEYE